MKYFYDTSSLLNLQEQAFAEPFYVAVQTLQEIENIKTSSNKDNETKHKARKLARLLDERSDQYIIGFICSFEDFSNLSEDYGIELFADITLEENNDLMILCNAKFISHISTMSESEIAEIVRDDDGNISDIISIPNEEVVFVTDDIAQRILAKGMFGLESVGSHRQNADDYTGYSEIEMNEDEMAHFYSNLSTNQFDQLINEYLIISDTSSEIVDAVRWDGSQYTPIIRAGMKSNMFGNIKAYKGDIYQQCAIDSLSNNQITMLTGPAGSGKSHLALGYLFKQLDSHKIDKIVVFCNPVATMDSAKIGFLPGTKDQKLCDSGPGNMLSSKLGSRIELERLITDGKIELLPFSDLRGYDTSGMNCAIYIVEAQNLSVELMRLALQRCSEDSTVIIDGDFSTQIDDAHFGGSNNGMRRVSEIFRGQRCYGEVYLKTIYRSKIAELAQLM